MKDGDVPVPVLDGRLSSSLELLFFVDRLSFSRCITVCISSSRFAISSFSFIIDPLSAS